MINRIYLLSITILILFSGCATVDRGNFGFFQIDPLSNTYRNNYDIIDTRKEKINIPKSKNHIIEKFVVVDGGCSGQDCGDLRGNGNYGDRERIELKKPKENRDTFNNSDFWYTWSIYFPKNYISIYPAQSCYGQFYNSSSPNPYYMFVDADGYRIKKPGGIYSKPLIKKKNLRGKWYNIKIHAIWSTNPNRGLFKVWVNNKLKYTFKGRTYFGVPYFKYGIYRTYVTNYKINLVRKYINKINSKRLTYREKFLKALKTVKVPSQTVYYSDVMRFNSEEDLKHYFMYKNYY